MTSASSSTAICRCRLTYVTAVCRIGYYQLQQAVLSLSEDASKTLVQAFVSCRLDYCNSLFFGISEGLMNRLQSVHNSAARLVTGTRCSEPHIADAPSATTLATSAPARADVLSPMLASRTCVVRDADIQHLWRQSVIGCRPGARTMEQSSIAPERR